MPKRFENIPAKIKTETAVSVVRRLAQAAPPPAVSRIDFETAAPAIFASSSFWELLYAKCYYGLALDVRRSIEGERMNADSKTTLAGIAGGLLIALGEYLTSGQAFTWRGLASFIALALLGKLSAGTKSETP